MEAVGLMNFRKMVSVQPKVEGRPVYYSTYDYTDPSGGEETEADRYRSIKIFPSISLYATILKIDYIKEASALENDGDEPLMPVEDRIVLFYGALSHAWGSIGRNPEEAERHRSRFNEKLARMMGKMEDTQDKPQLTPDSKYMANMRQNRIRGTARNAGITGGQGSYSAPSYLSGVTINTATITGNVTVSSGVTIDGRDISADGATMDAHLVDTTDAHDASAISVVASGNLAATDVQTALTELQTDIDSRALDADLDAHVADTTDAHAASAITNTPSGNLAATTVQGALNELQTDVDTRATSTALTDHISDATDAHAASAITSTPSGNLAATTVQAALNELQTDVDTRATSTALTDHISDATDAHAASAITNTPSGNLAATTVQAALNELQTDVDGLSAGASSADELTNLGLACSVGSSALTIALKQADGSTDPASGSGAVKIGFRSSTLTSGAYNQRSVTGALSLTISSGSTLGHSSGNAHYIYVYAIDNAGTVELAVSQTLYPENQRISTTAEGGAGAADSNSTIYSTTARTNVPFRVIGVLTSTQTTAGTWAAVPTTTHTANYGVAAATNVIAAYGKGAPTGTLNNSFNIVKFPVSKQTHGAYSASTGEFTVPAGADGWYECSGTMELDHGSVSAGTSMALGIYVDADYKHIGQKRFHSTNPKTDTAQVSGAVYATAGQTITFRSYTSGTTPAFVTAITDSSFSIVYRGK
jgi:hypothetical protein